MSGRDCDLCGADHASALSASEPSALPGEMWRGVDGDGDHIGIDADGFCRIWTDGHWAADGGPMFREHVYRIAFGEERARADRAEREAHRLEQQVTQLMGELAEKREAHRQDHEALAAFQRASGCADGVTLAAVLRERNALVRDLRDVATEKTPHEYMGACPNVKGEGIATADDRDDGCEACAVLSRADAALVGSHRGDA